VGSRPSWLGRGLWNLGVQWFVRPSTGAKLKHLGSEGGIVGLQDMSASTLREQGTEKRMSRERTDTPTDQVLET
jgi:hypothetical protein